ncbi:hypothetical protein AK812_SmicGene9708 [Symbiodinium microadriaticum]|uniref:Uncharacterized protein n=1 Tax=Symbiodinium microadriaticum TaxID=2951 RepID=A0A1Q9EHW0_SYMMI|nr:hypothetical protein AK812_SmicGene9708 [Symbiodinium microadriaticum]
MQRIDGMPTILITGWQAYRDNKGRFGSSHYSKDEALWIRTETNPVVGVTTESVIESVFSELLPFGRDAGHKVYEHKQGSKIIRYFMNSWGTQKIAADGKITRKLEEIKRDVLDLTEKLERSPAISESDSGRSSLKETSALVQEANQMLNIMETFPMRLVPEAGDFPEAAKRAAQTDMKNWRRGRDRLTIQQYREAGSKSISAVRSEKSYSVPAKLHNTLVDFMKKRPHMLIRFLKHETNDKCVLSDKTDSDRERLGTFLNYYMSVPGYSTNDLKDVTLDLPAHCQDYLVSEEAADPESIVQTAGEAQQILSNSTSSGSEGGLLQVKSERLARALGPDGTSFLQSGTSSDFAADESDRAQEVFFIIACIVVCLACFIVATMFFMLGFASLAGCFGGGGGGGGCFAAYFVCMILGALIIWGAFAMATPVGIAALVASIVVLIGSAIFKVANLEIREHDFAKPPPPNWRAISHLAM